MEDKINHPKHYTQYNHEVIELTRHMSFVAGNLAKYVLRAPFKGNKKEDLLKAKWYNEERIASQAKVFISNPPADVAKYFCDVSPIIRALVNNPSTVGELIKQSIENLEIDELRHQVSVLTKRIKEQEIELEKYKTHDPEDEIKDLFGKLYVL